MLGGARCRHDAAEGAEHALNVLRFRFDLVLDFDDEVDVDGDGLVVEHGGAPTELANCLDDARIEFRGEGLHNFNVSGAAGLVEIELENHFRRVGERR